ncbi:MAG: flagellar protein FlgN [Porticoccus sp.]|nr:flagellar protein FlgN [Porticoccus sp.]
MSLHALFNTQKTYLEQLEALLESEQSELMSAGINGDLLSQLAEEKSGKIQMLERLELQRRNAQKQLGYTDDLQGTEQATKDAGCLNEWQDILATAERVIHQNNVNGSLIERQLTHNQKALNTLTEVSGKPLYGSDGRSPQNRSSVNSSA